MATKFQITESTKRTFLKVEGALVVVGTQYDIELQEQMTVDNILGFKAEPLDSFKYKVIVDGVASINEATVLINFETDKTSRPATLVVNETIAINDSLFFSNLVYSENNYDRIVITDIIGKGDWLLNNALLVVGSTIFFYELVGKLLFYANEEGSKEAYNVLKWKAANIIETFPEENELTINTTSLGVLENVSEELILETFTGYESYSATLNIQHGKAGAAYELVIDTTAFPNIGINPENSVNLLVNGSSTILSASGVFTFNQTLDESGAQSIQLIVSRKSPSTVQSFVTATLSTIDTLSSNVDALSNKKVITIPITI
jgi:hypothetical protein